MAVVHLGRLRSLARLADAHAAGANIRDFVANHLPGLTAATQFQCVSGQVSERAVFNRAVPRKLRSHIATDRDRSLTVRVAIRARVPIGITESKSTQDDI